MVILIKDKDGNIKDINNQYSKEEIKIIEAIEEAMIKEKEDFTIEMENNKFEWITPISKKGYFFIKGHNFQFFALFDLYLEIPISDIKKINNQKI